MTSVSSDHILENLFVMTLNRLNFQEKFGYIPKRICSRKRDRFHLNLRLSVDHVQAWLLFSDS